MICFGAGSWHGQGSVCLITRCGASAAVAEKRGLDLMILHLLVLFAWLDGAEPPRSDEALRDVLCSSAKTPIDHLSVGGRIRLLESIKFQGDGAIASYRPLAYDVTAAEKEAIVDFLGLEIYRDFPEARLRETAGSNSHGRPHAGSAYCAGQESLKAWAEGARDQIEGSLSVVTADVRAEASNFSGQGLQPQQHRDQQAEIYRRLLAFSSDSQRLETADFWPLSEFVDVLTFGAIVTEDRELLEAAARRLDGRAGTDRDLSREKRDVRVLLDRLDLDRQPDAGHQYVYRWTKMQRVERLALTPSPRIIVISSAHCAFSRRLMGALSVDGSLPPDMIENILFLVPPTEDLSSPAYQDLIEANPDLSIASASLKHDWPDLRFAQTPQAYLVANGRSEDVFTGWPADEAQQQHRLTLLRQAMISMRRSE